MKLFDVGDVVDTDHWYTPPWVFEGMAVTFDLDVAAPVGGVPWVPARRSYSVDDDGLTEPWDGLVWCNPPYSAPTAWCRRWAEHSPGGCLLIRADLSTSGPFVAWSAAHAMYVHRKRIQFVSGSGVPSGSVNFSTVILARGDECVAGLQRLAHACGGSCHTFRQVAA